MEGTPQGIKFEDVVSTVESVQGVKSLHDLHIWSLASNRNALSGHIVVNSQMTVREIQPIIRQIENTLEEKFGIGHVTIQLEDEDHPHGNEMFNIDHN